MFQVINGGYSLIWNDELGKNLKKNTNRVAGKQEPWTCSYVGVYGSSYNYQNLMKLILNETRHLELSNYRNYKVIGLVLSEI